MNYPRSKLPPLGLRSDHASPLKTLLTAFLGHLRAFITGTPQASGPVGGATAGLLTQSLPKLWSSSAGPWQQPAHHSFVRVTPTWLKFVLLDCPLRKVGCLLGHLPPVLRKRHPLANDLPARLVIFHLGTFDDFSGCSPSFLFVANESTT
jgi:hypothetical protein